MTKTKTTRLTVTDKQGEIMTRVALLDALDRLICDSMESEASHYTARTVTEDADYLYRYIRNKTA